METLLLEDEEIAIKLPEKEVVGVEKSNKIIIDFGDLLDFDKDEVLLTLSSLNSPLQLETNQNNHLIISMATHSKTGNKNARLTAKVVNWNEEKESGEVFDSSAGFRLPITNSVKSPDVAFILNSKLEKLSEKDAEGFYKIAPDFVIELRSDSDSLKELIDKMLEYIENGVRLGWLIDTKGEKVYIYRLNGRHTTQTFDEKLSGEDVLPKFELEIRQLWKKK